ncbi:MAG: site-specific DNA-methyltransferase [Acidobacteriales bacterium]|nr:site-specific DNA-methyltransferase [Terriglobales bacterium]
MGKTAASIPADSASLAHIAALDGRLEAKFRDRLKIQPQLTRQLVSFQANKERAGYRWYKYKEAFSASLVEYFLHKYEISGGCILDPFAGMGTTLFCASALGLDSVGIELLPVGRQLIETRLLVERSLDKADLGRVRQWRQDKPWERSSVTLGVPALRITTGAYPPDTLASIERFLGACQRENVRVQAVLRLALLCILESISYTRKDGQYLRWDHRSGRRQGSRPFDKGQILPFDKAMAAKLHEILSDIEQKPSADLFAQPCNAGAIHLMPGSCLDVLPHLRNDEYQAIFTSPPYCNRYDYTRTYALELALLGIDETVLSTLRQEMLSCTVENRSKDLLSKNAEWARAVAVADGLELLQEILKYLEGMKARDALNNPGIPRMVRGYFYEMACVLAECGRVLKPGGLLIMVNDNVRYAGACVSVDLILSEMADLLGLTVEKIFVLPNGKGNSSQQMGLHGRDELRKCVYVWRKA